jgi:hypothetical protein
MDIKLRDKISTCKRGQTYELSFQRWEIHWRSRLMAGETSATHVPLLYVAPVEEAIHTLIRAYALWMMGVEEVVEGCL